jgi:hypothetical protein
MPARPYRDVYERGIGAIDAAPGDRDEVIAELGVPAADEHDRDGREQK